MGLVSQTWELGMWCDLFSLFGWLCSNCLYCRIWVRSPPFITHLPLYHPPCQCVHLLLKTPSAKMLYPRPFCFDEVTGRMRDHGSLTTGLEPMWSPPGLTSTHPPRLSTPVSFTTTYSGSHTPSTRLFTFRQCTCSSLSQTRSDGGSDVHKSVSGPLFINLVYWDSRVGC